MRYLEDFRVGDTYDLGAVVVDADEAMWFARRFDPQPFHIDPIAAKESWFEGLVVSGWFVAALFMRRFVDVLLADSACDGSPGVDQMRFHRPVRPGERLTARATVMAITPSLTKPETGILQPRCEVLDPAGAVAFSMILHSMFRRRSEEGIRGSGM
ncbi:MAG TPA: MaoC/PaaZ C-terminal domain-containing protein [Pseudonocardiaceae bacterium]|jgi:acyl dehydratase|nr:MaoC/PaaZ C-terminal domain-containing protein [Pseudonocardiaceae bacterium]